MGGAKGTAAIVAGAARASLPTSSGDRQGIEIVLVGDERAIAECLSRERYNPERLSVLNAARDESVQEAVRLAADGRAAAVISAGPAAMTIAACQRYLEPLAGVRRPALGAVYPTAATHGRRSDPFTLLLDVGACPDADADDLVSFALLGAAYARAISQNEVPRVALLSASAEPSAAPAAAVAAAERLVTTAGLQYVGLIEAVDVPKGLADVVVTDGFAGNTVIKLLDGVREIVLGLASYAQKERLLWKIGLRMLSGALSRVKQLTDWEEYGGAPLLGYQTVILRTHAQSEGQAIHNACRLAAKAVAADVPKAFAELRGPAPLRAEHAAQSIPA
jgi:glycerol-3-phosphate acyltransferase PlsX